MAKGYGPTGVSFSLRFEEFKDIIANHKIEMSAYIDSLSLEIWQDKTDYLRNCEKADIKGIFEKMDSMAMRKDKSGYIILF